MSLFALNPGPLPYGHPLVVTLVVCGVLLLLIAPFVRSRARSVSGSMRKVARTWSPLLIVFGMIGIVLGVSRAEGITFLSMQFLVLLWGVLFLVIFTLHALLYRKRSYTVLPTERVEDPRDKYLPKSRRR